VRTVDINRQDCQGIDWKSPVAAQYSIRSIPAFMIFGPGKDKISTGAVARQQVLTCLRGDTE
jgi:hypothetical protein